MANSYEVPSWASKPPNGHHLDVLKDDKLIQKLMIDEKKCYLFGRNPQMNDVCIDHASCSRVHAALVYHEFLKKAFLVDLGSTHGTWIGSVRLDGHKPTQLQIDSVFSFGASTRKYILRERPNATIPLGSSLLDEMQIEGSEGALLGLPESQTELDNLTEYNTAHNRRILMLGINEDSIRKPNSNSKRKRKHITFNDDEIIINPEDVDPSVGRFRNLVQTTVLPAKRLKYETNSMGIPHFTKPATIQPIISLADKTLQSSLYHGIPIPDAGASGSKPHHPLDIDVTQVALGSKLGLLLPNPAPDVNPEEPVVDPKVQFSSATVASGPITYEESMMIETQTPGGPQKKKYAKESWPGRKPLAAPL